MSIEQHMTDVYSKAIREAVKENVPCTWKQIMAKVKESNPKFIDWLMVRSALQQMLDKKELRRVPDIRTESYVPFNHTDGGS